MYFFYIDETGNLDPRSEITREDGSTITGDPIFVLTAVSLFEHQWHGFAKTIDRFKLLLARRVCERKGIRLDLADCEIKSNWLRQPKARAAHPFLSGLTDQEIQQLIGLFYRQLEHHNMHIFSVVIDKRHLHDYFDQEKLQRKAWELLLEQIEQFMRAKHSRHQALMVNDDVSVQANKRLAMKHSYMLHQGTRSNMWLKHVCEMPMFVRSELSNGIQLADLCSYNIYRAFKNGDMSYRYFDEIVSFIWSRSEPITRPFSGIRIFPDDSPLNRLVDELEMKRACTDEGAGS